MKLSLNLLKGLNLNNVLNANIGLREILVAQQWPASVGNSFAMIVEGLDAHMAHAPTLAETYLL